MAAIRDRRVAAAIGRTRTVRQPAIALGHYPSLTLCARERSVQVKFIVGHDHGALAMEADEFGDILFVDVPESYDNLNLKLLAAMSIVHARFQYRFVFHADDDSFVRIDLLLPERGRTASRF